MNQPDLSALQGEALKPLAAMMEGQSPDQRGRILLVAQGAVRDALAKAAAGVALDAAAEANPIRRAVFEVLEKAAKPAEPALDPADVKLAADVREGLQKMVAQQTALARKALGLDPPEPELRKGFSSVLAAIGRGGFRAAARQFAPGPSNFAGSIARGYMGAANRAGAMAQRAARGVVNRQAKAVGGRAGAEAAGKFAVRSGSQVERANMTRVVGGKLTGKNPMYQEIVGGQVLPNTGRAARDAAHMKGADLVGRVARQGAERRYMAETGRATIKGAGRAGRAAFHGTAAAAGGAAIAAGAVDNERRPSGWERWRRKRGEG